jgi:hypothetical protein
VRERAVTEGGPVACRFVVVLGVGHDTWKRSFQTYIPGIHYTPNSDLWDFEDGGEGSHRERRRRR